MTASLIVRHNVADYPAWRDVYESVEALRGQHGCVEAEVMVAPDDKQDVFVIHKFPTLGQAEAFASDHELKAAMARGGVAGPPRIELAVSI